MCVDFDRSWTISPDGFVFWLKVTLQVKNILTGGFVSYSHTAFNFAKKDKNRSLPTRHVQKRSSPSPNFWHFLWRLHGSQRGLTDKWTGFCGLGQMSVNIYIRYYKISHILTLVGFEHVLQWHTTESVPFIKHGRKHNQK